MKKLFVISSVLVGLFLGTSAQAQLGPPEPGTVAFIDVLFEGGAVVAGGEIAGGFAAFPIDGYIDDGIDPYGLYSWCFDVLVEYEYGYETEGGGPSGGDSGLLEESFDLGVAAPAEVLEYLFTAPLPSPPVSGEDIVSFYNAIPGVSPVGGLADPFGLGIIDDSVFFEVDVDDFPLVFVDFAGLTEADPFLIGEVEFIGIARLSIKETGGVIPEPSTYGMIGAGFLVALVFFRRRAMTKKAA